MPKITRSFLAGKMNKVADQRVLPEGEYVDAMNIRMASTEYSEQGVIHNTLGNVPLTALYYKGLQLSIDATTIGSYGDSTRNTIYWFVHDPNFGTSPLPTKVDMIVSYNVLQDTLTYNVISAKDPLNNTNTTLNFNPKYLITGVDMIGDMLFFTDDYNQPRYINVTKSYPQPDVSNIDDPLLAEMLLVVKRPPLNAPTVELSTIGTDDDGGFLIDRMISFAYRYRYADGMYSATSPWSDIAFNPDNFQFSINSYLNEGMTNQFNTANVTYYNGSKLVEGIDLLFKEANKNIIKVIQKLDKSDLLPDQYSTFQFSDSKIFTVLSESELLRLFDNVPLKAKAQTIMGNRLMYGNYVDGYNLINVNGQQIDIDYTTELITKDIGSKEVPTSYQFADYGVDGVNTVFDCVLRIDLANIPLKEGASISIDFTITHAEFTGTITPNTQTQNTQYSIDITLKNDYASVYQLSLSPEFKNAIGTLTNIKPMSLACDGATLTDIVNCGLPGTLTDGTVTLNKNNYGITILQEPIKIISQPTGANKDTIRLQLTATKYQDLTTPGNYAFEYYKFINANVEYIEIASPRSLHSNRDYEIGIVYMDEYGRASTALVSSSNTEHVPCSNSDTQNQIQVTINNLPPIWAKKYKFVIKSSGYNYETIYSSISYKDPDTPYVYFLLEGENARKVEAGDRLIVKADSNGPTGSCVYATVLEKEAKEKDFITPVEGAKPPSGVYMKMSPNDFAVAAGSTFAPGEKDATASLDGDYPVLKYTVNEFNPATSQYDDVSIPAGSRVTLKFKFERIGTGDGNKKCERRIYTLEKTLISSTDYANMYDWWIGDNVESILNSGISIVGGTGCPIGNEFYSALVPLPTPTSPIVPFAPDYCNNRYGFVRVISTNELYLYITGTRACGRLPKKRSRVWATIEVYQNTGNYIFETEPTDTLPDVFYENHLSFDITGGYHMGNVQNQTSTLPAIIDTGFFNCFAFGNGAESYKVRDSIVGKDFNLGERVTTVAQLEYKEADRFADITYSGVYNEETNLNKLNEFNLGLVNYKNLERSFGDIYILDGRQTDVLVLQEDKISYVLAGKNLLSDANAGNVITATPEVLGTQIARSETFGISFNPESYVKWGYDRFFTDVKRNAVLQIRGESSQSDQLVVISEMGMRTWFRDMFIGTQNKQKLGGYDPYMNEYVLATNEIDLPIDEQCVDCGMSKTFNLFFPLDSGLYDEFIYCVDFGTDIDSSTDINVTATIGGGSEYKVNVVYDNVTSTQMALFNKNNGYTPQTFTNNFTFNKNKQLVETGNIKIRYRGDIVITITAKCPAPSNINIVELVLTNPADSGKSLHNTWQYKNGAYISTLQSNPNTFATSVSSPAITRYSMSTGPRGGTIFPEAGCQVIMGTKKIGYDNFGFDPNNSRLRYVASTSQLPAATLLANLSSYTIVSPITPSTLGANTYTAPFTLTSSDNYLHLIWDFRKPYLVYLCYGDENSLPKEVGCDCNKCVDCYTIKFTRLNTAAGKAYLHLPIGSVCNEINAAEDIEITIVGTTLCIPVQDWYIKSGDVKVEFQYCECTCNNCRSYSLNNNYGYVTDIEYTDCETEDVVTDTLINSNSIWCAEKDSFSITNVDGSPFGWVESKGCGCCPDPNNQCVTYLLDAITSGTLTYTDCNGDEAVEVVLEGSKYYFCGDVTEPPLFEGAEYSLVVHNPCGCYT